MNMFSPINNVYSSDPIEYCSYNHNTIPPIRVKIDVKSNYFVHRLLGRVEMYGR